MPYRCEDIYDTYDVFCVADTSTGARLSLCTSCQPSAVIHTCDHVRVACRMRVVRFIVLDRMLHVLCSAFLAHDKAYVLGVQKLAESLQVPPAFCCGIHLCVFMHCTPCATL